MQKLITLLLLASSSLALANEKNCQQLKDAFIEKHTTSVELKPRFIELESRIKSNEVCAKNLLGRIYFEGLGVDKDVDRAHAIFYELANSGYPPAQFNLAYVLSKKQGVEPEIVLGFLQGLIVNYTGQYDYGYIAIKARDLGREYLEELSSLNKSKLAFDFESLVRTATTNAAVQIRQNTIARGEKEDNIMGMITMGVYGAAIGSRLSGAFNNAPRMQFNSIQPRVYSVHPIGGNYLWVVPH